MTSLVRTTAEKLGRVDRRGVTVGLAYPVVAAGAVVLVANLVGDVVSAAFEVRKDLAATFTAVSGILFFAWFAEALIRWVLAQWMRHDTAVGISGKNG